MREIDSIVGLRNSHRINLINLVSDSNNIYFFPFSSNFDNLISKIDHPQAAYITAYPQFLFDLFSSIESLNCYQYTPVLSMDESTREVGISNWSIDSLIRLVEMRNDPLTGIGITGYMDIQRNENSTIQLLLFRIDTGTIIYQEKYIADTDSIDILKVLVGSIINDIVMKGNLISHFSGHTMDLHQSIIQTPIGYLTYLKMKGLIANYNTIGEEFDINHQLSIIEEGFRAQNDFLVLQLMYIDILKNSYITPQHKERVIEIDGLISNKTTEYITLYTKIVKQ